MMKIAPGRGGIAVALLACLLLAGCGLQFAMHPPQEPAMGAGRGRADTSSERGGLKPEQTSKEEAAINAALQYVQNQQQTYKIGAADLLEISVFQESELNRKVRVSPDGIITLPLVGKVQVGGRGVADAESAVRERLSRYIVEPQVSVFISEYGNKTVFVLGEVSRPGSYSLPTEAPLTVIEAVTLAGGFTNFAAVDRTRVIRNAAGRSESFVVEISAITKRGDKSKDVRLRPNDVVYVPESFF